MWLEAQQTCSLPGGMNLDRSLRFSRPKITPLRSGGVFEI